MTVQGKRRPARSSSHHKGVRARLTDPPRCVAYVRCSKDTQDLSPEVQRIAIDKWCAEHDADLLVVHEDIGVGGALDLEERPGLMRALSSLQKLRANVLLVAKRDRLARNLLNACMIESLVERSGAQIISADGMGNGLGPEAEMLRGILNVFAQYERALISMRTKAALNVIRANGGHFGQRPYGWRIESKRLIPDPEEQSVIRRIHQARAEGHFVSAICRRLRETGVQPRGKRWHATSIYRILAMREEDGVFRMHRGEEISPRKDGQPPSINNGPDFAPFSCAGAAPGRGKEG